MRGRWLLLSGAAATLVAVSQASAVRSGLPREYLIVTHPGMSRAGIERAIGGSFPPDSACSLVLVDSTTPEHRPTEGPCTLRPAPGRAPSIVRALELYAAQFEERSLARRMLDELLPPDRRAVVVFDASSLEDSFGYGQARVRRVGQLASRLRRVHVAVYVASGEAETRSLRSSSLEIRMERDVLMTRAPGGPEAPIDVAFDLVVRDPPPRGLVAGGRATCGLGPVCFEDRDCESNRCLAPGVCYTGAGAAVQARQRTTQLGPPSYDGGRLVFSSDDFQLGELVGARLPAGWHPLRCRLELSGEGGFASRPLVAEVYLQARRRQVYVVHGTENGYRTAGSPSEPPLAEVGVHLAAVRDAITHGASHIGQTRELETLDALLQDIVEHEPEILVLHALSEAELRGLDCPRIAEFVERGTALVVISPPTERGYPCKDTLPLPAYRRGESFLDRRPRVRVMPDPALLGRTPFAPTGLTANGATLVPLVDGLKLQADIARRAGLGGSLSSDPDAHRFAVAERCTVDWEATMPDPTEEPGRHRPRLRSQLRQVLDRSNCSPAQNRVGVNDIDVALSYFFDWESITLALASRSDFEGDLVLVPIATPYLPHTGEPDEGREQRELRRRVAQALSRLDASSASRTWVCGMNGCARGIGRDQRFASVRDARTAEPVARHIRETFVTPLRTGRRGDRRFDADRVGLRVEATGRVFAPSLRARVEPASNEYPDWSVHPPPWVSVPLAPPRTPTTLEHGLLSLAPPETPARFDEAVLAAAAVRGDGQIIVLGYSPFEGGGAYGRFDDVSWSADGEVATFGAEDESPMYGATFIDALSESTLALLPMGGEVPAVTGVRATADGTMVVEVRQAITPHSLSADPFELQASSCSEDPASAGTRPSIRAFSQADQSIDLEIGPEAIRALCRGQSEDECQLYLCSSRVRAAPADINQDRFRIWPGRSVRRATENAGDGIAVTAIVALQALVGLSGGTIGRVDVAHAVPVRKALLVLLGVLVLALAGWIRWTRSRAGGGEPADLRDRVEPDVSEGAGPWGAGAPTASAVGDPAPVRPGEPGDPASLAEARDLAIFAIDAESAAPPRTRLRRPPSPVAVGIFANLDLHEEEGTTSMLPAVVARIAGTARTRGQVCALTLIHAGRTMQALGSHEDVHDPRFVREFIRRAAHLRGERGSATIVPLLSDDPNLLVCLSPFPPERVWGPDVERAVRQLAAGGTSVVLCLLAASGRNGNSPEGSVWAGRGPWLRLGWTERDRRGVAIEVVAQISGELGDKALVAGLLDTADLDQLVEFLDSILSGGGN